MKWALIAIALISVAQAFATSVLKKPLRELVAEADYIVVGTLMKRAMFDENGREVKDPNARTGPGTKNELRLYVRLDPSGILKSIEKKIPDEIVITRFRGHIAELGKDVGPQSRPQIFLLKAAPLEEVYPRDSIRDILDRPMIEKLIEGTKKTNQTPEPTSGLAPVRGTS